MTAEKDVQVARKKGRGGRGNLGNARKKTFFFKGGVPLERVFDPRPVVPPNPTQPRSYQPIYIDTTRHAVPPFFLMPSPIHLSNFPQALAKGDY